MSPIANIEQVYAKCQELGVGPQELLAWCHAKDAQNDVDVNELSVADAPDVIMEGLNEDLPYIYELAEGMFNIMLKEAEDV